MTDQKYGTLTYETEDADGNKMVLVADRVVEMQERPVLALRSSPYREDPVAVPTRKVVLEFKLERHPESGHTHTITVSDGPLTRVAKELARFAACPPWSQLEKGNQDYWIRQAERVLELAQ